MNSRFRSVHGLSPSDGNDISKVISDGGREVSLNDVEDLAARAAGTHDGGNTRRAADDTSISIQEVFSKGGFSLAVEDDPSVIELTTAPWAWLVTWLAAGHILSQKRRETEQLPVRATAFLEMPKHLRAGFTFDKDLDPIFGVSG